jgi:hypothetical protein
VLIVGHDGSAGDNEAVVLIDPAEGLKRSVGYDKKTVFLRSYGKPPFRGTTFYTKPWSPS